MVNKFRKDKLETPIHKQDSVQPTKQEHKEEDILNNQQNEIDTTDLKTD